VKHKVSKESTRSEENSADIVFDIRSLENTEKREKRTSNSEVPTTTVRKNNKFLRSKLSWNSYSSCGLSLNKLKQHMTARKKLECL